MSRRTVGHIAGALLGIGLAVSAGFGLRNYLDSMDAERRLYEGGAVAEYAAEAVASAVETPTKPAASSHPKRKYELKDLCRIEEGWIYPNEVDRKGKGWKYDFTDKEQAVLAFCEGWNNADPALHRMLISRDALEKNRKRIREKSERLGSNTDELFDAELRTCFLQQPRILWYRILSFEPPIGSEETRAILQVYLEESKPAKPEGKNIREEKISLPMLQEADGWKIMKF